MKSHKLNLAILFLIIGGLAFILIRNAATTKPKERTLEETLESGMNSDVLIVTVFLGYRFGMTPVDFKKHSRRLKRDGKISDIIEGVPIYEMSVGDVIKKAITWTHPEYFDDELFKVLVVAEADKESFSNELLQLQLVKLYVAKYKGKMFKTPSALDDSDVYTWIIDNLEIKISNSSDGVLISYTNLPVFAKKQKQEKDLQNTEIEKTKSDI